jgi:hypothetical protein
MAAMTTKRTPRTPPGGKRITPAAVQAFRAMQAIEDVGCDCQRGCKDGNDCKVWKEQDRILRHEMRLPPWEFPTYGRGISGHCDADCLARYHALKAAVDAADEAAKKAPV